MTPEQLARIRADAELGYGAGSKQTRALCDHIAKLEAGRDAVLEEAATIADSMSSDYRAMYKGRHPHAHDNVGRANPYYDGLSDGAYEAADAIRALKSAPASAKEA